MGAKERQLADSIEIVHFPVSHFRVFRTICGYRALAARDKQGCRKEELREILHRNRYDYSVTRSFDRMENV